MESHTQMKYLSTTNTNTNNVMFSWKNLIFCAYLVRRKLILNWRTVDLVFSSNKQNNVDGCPDDTAGGNESWSDDDEKNGSGPQSLERKESWRRSDDFETSEVNSASLNVDRWKGCEIVTAGYSFDENLIKRIPVLLLQCECGNTEDKESSLVYEYIYVKVTDSLSRMNCNSAHKSRLTAKRRNTSPEFVLTPVRSYSHTFHCCELPTISQNDPTFLSSLQLLFINKNNNTLSLYTQDIFSLHNYIQNFDLADSNKKLSDINILDAYSIQEDRTLVVIIHFKTDVEQVRCQCLKFSPNVSFNSNSASEKYDMMHLPTDILFVPDFAEIVKAVNILSFDSSRSLITGSSSCCTSVIMITHTGYALKFIDGAMSCCVNLLDFGDEACEHSEVNWSSAVVKIINFEGCSKRTAVQINTSCHLIDWTCRKIVKSWHSILTAISCDILSCGISSLLLVFQPENDHFSDTQDLCVLLQEAEFKVVDVDCELQSDDEGNDDNRGIMFGSDVPRQTDENFVNQPSCAVRALQEQQKKSEEAVTELEAELKSKLSFLTTTWQQFTGTHIDDVGVSQRTNFSEVSNRLVRGLDTLNRSQRTTCSEPPLAVLVEGSLPSCQKKKWGHRCGNGSSKTARRYTELGTFWKRIVDSQLVVGVSVQNLSERSLSDIFLNIIPTSGGQAPIFQSTSKCGKSQGTESAGGRILLGSGNSLQRQSGTYTMAFGQCSDFNKECLLPPGHSVVTICTADISQAVSAADLTFHTFLSYSVLIDDNYPPEMQKNDELFERDVEECCCELTITLYDLLNETYSIKISTDGSVSAMTSQDLVALDCLQDSLVLTVKSVVSSVTCLSLKLNSHSSIRYLEWAEQYLFVTTSSLKYCRVQILEQYSRSKAMIKVFSRSHSQLLLVIKFLYSILPKDITITPNPPSSLSAVICSGQAVLQNIDSKINTIKQQIDNLTNVAPSNEEEMPQEESLSPKFHAKKSYKIKPEVSKSTPVLGASRCKSVDCGEDMGVIVREKNLFRRAKKRFREIWSDDESPESG